MLPPSPAPLANTPNLPPPKTFPMPSSLRADLRRQLLVADDATLHRVAELLRPATVAVANTPDSSHQAVRHLLLGERVEVLVGCFLARSLKVLSVEVLSRGTDSYAILDPATILRRALALRAHAYLVAHNHPSGDRNPSPEDLATTVRLRLASEAVGIRLVDHLIVTDTSYFSMAAHGLIHGSSK